VVPIAIDPANPLTMYAGSYGSGVYKSLDGGLTWTSISQGLTNLFIYSLAIDPLNTSTLYAGTYRSQVYKSTNGGSTWSWSGTGMQAQAIVYDLAVDPVSTNLIYATTRGVSNNGSAPWSGILYRSTNAGTTWDPILQNLGGAGLQDWLYDVLVNPHAHNEVLIAAHESGPFRSDDYGGSFYPIDNGILDYSGRAIAVGLQDPLASMYYYGVWHVDTIYKSTNRGGSWVPINDGFTYQHVYSIALDPQNGNNVYLGTFQSGVLKSTDGGINWQPSGLALDHVFNVTIKPDTPNYLLAGTEGDGIYRSGNSGTSWDHSTTGLENAMTTSAILTPIDPGRIYTSIFGAGVYQSVDQGHNWGEVNLGLTDRFVLDMINDPAHPGVLYALTNEGGLFKNDVSTGNGWTTTGQGLPQASKYQPAFPADHPFASLDMIEPVPDLPAIESNTIAGFAPLTTMTYAPSNPQIAYIGTSGSGVYRSSDGGQTWQAAGLSTSSITSLAVDLGNPSLVYAATDLAGSIAVSTDGGNNWNTYGLPVTFYSLTASPTTAGLVYAGTSDGIYTFQSGVFTRLLFYGQKVTAIEFNPANPSHMYTGTDQNAYYSLNGGLSWTTVDANLSGKTIYSISVDPFNPDLVFFCTTTHGIFLATIQ
jgi:photosystem II stability/assembly factor-like uncharacterized protein